MQFHMRFHVRVCSIYHSTDMKLDLKSDTKSHVLCKQYQFRVGQEIASTCENKIARVLDPLQERSATFATLSAGLNWRPGLKPEIIILLLNSATTRLRTGLIPSPFSTSKK
jgi:hypothetical protein